MATLSEMVIKIGADASGLSAGLNKAQQDINKTFSVNPVNEFSDALTGTTGKVDKLIGSFSSLAKIAATGFGLSSLISGAVDAGEAAYQLANRLKISYAEAGKLSRILKLTGGDADTCGAAFMRLDKTLMSDGEAGERARTMLDAVGVSLTDSAGKILPLNEQLKNLSEGYKKAADAGYGQEFIMNTLGVRGMALTKTLQNYTEAAENAAKIKSIGIDPEEMHRISQQLKLVEMQAGQLKNVGGAVIAPIAADVFPPIIAGLAKTAQYVAENKKELKSLAKTGLEVVAVYKTMQAAAKISAGVAAVWRAAQVAQMAQSAPQVDLAALTATQEKSIARRMRRIDQLTEKEIKAMEKTVAKMAISEEEKVRIATTSAMRIEQAAAQRAAQEQLYMTEMYRKTNLQAAQSAQAQIAAMQTVRVESAGAAAQLVGDHTRAGAAAKAAGAQSVVAHEAGAAAARVHASAVQTVAAANVTAGTTAMGAGATTVTAMGTASRMVRSAASAVFALAGGWIGVAAAIGYATYKLWEYNKEQAAEREKNTYEVNGQKYLERDGTFYRLEQDVDPIAVANGNMMGSMTREYEVQETDARTLEDLNAAWYERHKNDEDYLFELQKEAAEKQNEAADLALQEAMRRLNDDAGEKSAALQEEKIKTYEIEVQIGEEVLDEARARIGADYELGALGDDGGGLAYDCGKLVLDAFKAAGVAFENRYVPDMIEEAKRKGAWHEAGDGYVPQAGDAAVVLGDDHVVLSNGKGGYVGANSSTGVVEKDSIAADFGAVTGYISVAELTGGATIKKTVGESDKAAQEEIKKLNQAKAQAVRLFQEMESEITSETKTAYESGMSKIAENVRAKQQEINKIAQAGIDTTELQAELAEYEHVLKEKLVNQQKEALQGVQREEKKITAEMAGDYAALAEAQYQETVARIEKERKEKYKAIATDKNIYEEELALNQWYNAELLRAAKEREDAMREINKKRLQDMQERGDVMGVKNYLATHGKAQQTDIDLAGQQELARAYVNIWNDAHASVYAGVASAMQTMNTSMAKSFEDVIMGTKSAKEAVADFGKSVMSMIAQIAAQKMAANIMLGLSGMAGGAGMAGGTAALSASAGMVGWGKSLPGIQPFADGGIVTAPTLGLIGEKGYREAVIPLTRGHMEKLGIGQPRETARPIQVIVQTPDAGSFRRSEAQIAASVRRAVNAGQRFS
nr:MAG TPA: Peptidoglycan endopeptidase [Caudoviricetes sp.]